MSTLALAILWAVAWVVLLAVASCDSALSRRHDRERPVPGSLRYMADQPRRLFLALVIGRDTALFGIAVIPVVQFSDLGLAALLPGAVGLIAAALAAAALVPRSPNLTRAAVPVVRVFFTAAAQVRRIAALVAPARLRANQPPNLLGEDILERVEEEAREERLDPSESDLIERLYEFDEATVRQAMTPRIEVFLLPVDVSSAALEAAIREQRRSRIPIYEREKENVIGILYTKDLVGEIGRDGFDLRQYLRKPRYVPLHMRVEELFREFRRDRVHAALVVDEYGALAGLVTMEDLLEQLFGDIRDEFGARAPELERLEDGTVRVSGRMPLARFADELDLTLGGPDAESMTVGGLVMRRLGRLPRKGDRVRFDQFDAVVESTRGLVLDHLRIEQWTSPSQ
ncbi:MAG: hemolysin (HlyC) family protein [Candidatus Binatota bacterium]|jgi:putative hemolysin|nr:hemolysin (HlyC) family protein [Candidatus Binatota bacterium]